MKYIIITILVLVIQIYQTNQSYAQKEDAIWMFADSAGLDFNFETPRVIKSEVSGRFEGAASAQATISDSSGKLLFYVRYAESGSRRDTNNFYRNETCLINWKNKKIENSDSLLLNESSYMGVTIFPVPESKSQYYVITHNRHIYKPGDSRKNYRKYDYQRYYYNVVDMSYNDGYGKILVKNKLLSLVSMVQRLNIVRHANGVDWWIITHERDSSDKFYIFKATSDNIFLEKTQKIGLLYDPDYEKRDRGSYCNFGISSFSKDGTKFVVPLACGGIELFDFDRCTGFLYNNKYYGIKKEDIYSPITSVTRYNSTCFSPDNRIIYISANRDSIYQLNIHGEMKLFPIASAYFKDTITQVESFLRSMQLNRDKIYIKKFNAQYENKNYYEIAAILNPNDSMKECNFSQEYIRPLR